MNCYFNLFALHFETVEEMASLFLFSALVLVKELVKTWYSFYFSHKSILYELCLLYKGLCYFFGKLTFLFFNISVLSSHIDFLCWCKMTLLLFPTLVSMRKSSNINLQFSRYSGSQVYK